jgi:hypothetical protein
MVAGGAALYKPGSMFEHKGASLGRMTFHAVILPKPAQAEARLRLVRVMAGDAIHNPFLKPVSFVVLKLHKDRTVTLRTCC